MTSVRLEFPGGSCHLQIPARLVERLRTFYPRVLALEGDLPEPAEPPLLGSFRIARRGRRWRLEREGRTLREFDRPAYALLALEHELEAEVLRRRGERLALHAGAVLVGDRACALAGRAEAGKTATTFQLLELGHAFLCEEITLVEPRGGRVLPFFQTLSLQGRFLDEFKQRFAVERGELTPLGGSLTRYAPRRLAPGPAALGWIVLPCYGPGRPGELLEVPAEEALPEILGYCFEPRGDEERFFDQMIELVSRVRILRFRYPDAAEARALLAERFPAGDE